MKNLKVWILLLFITVNISCVDSQKKDQKASKLSYDQAVEMLKEYVRDEKMIGLNKEVSFLYQPDNTFWKERYNNPSNEWFWEIEKCVAYRGGIIMHLHYFYSLPG